VDLQQEYNYLSKLIESYNHRVSESQKQIDDQELAFVNFALALEKISDFQRYPKYQCDFDKLKTYLLYRVNSENIVRNNHQNFQMLD
jgi:hypothetical protein